jgi:hypothetical protein
MKRIILFFLTILLSQACMLEDGTPIATTSTEYDIIQSGDIVVTNTLNDSIMLFSSTGAFKRVLYDVPFAQGGAVTVNGIAWNPVTREVFVAYDHTTATEDKILAISAATGAVRTAIQTVALQGTLSALAITSAGVVLIYESTTSIEKFSPDGNGGYTRIGNPFINPTPFTPGNQFSINSNGDLLVCGSAATPFMRTYSTSGTAGALVLSSNVAAVTAVATGCLQLRDGTFAVVQSANVVKNLAAVNSAAATWTLTDATNFTTATKVAQKSNGNLLVTDNSAAKNYIVEISSAGSFIQYWGDDYLQQPNGILVIP